MKLDQILEILANEEEYREDMVALAKSELRKLRLPKKELQNLLEGAKERAEKEKEYVRKQKNEVYKGFSWGALIVIALIALAWAIRGMIYIGENSGNIIVIAIGSGDSIDHFFSVGAFLVAICYLYVYWFIARTGRFTKWTRRVWLLFNRSIIVFLILALAAILAICYFWFFTNEKLVPLIRILTWCFALLAESTLLARKSLGYLTRLDAEGNYELNE